MPARPPAIQGVFRAANERLRNLMESVIRRGPLLVMCECGDVDCFEVMELDRDQYRSLRGAGHFVLLTGHCDPSVEHIVERHDGFDIVEKENPPE
jgi:hypothetical protein